MKKATLFLLSLVLILGLALSGPAQAATVKPGDTVTVDIPFSSSGEPLTGASIQFVASPGLDFVSGSAVPAGFFGFSPTGAVGFSMSGGISSGTVTITLKVADTATGELTFKITSLIGSGESEVDQSIGSPKTYTYTVDAPAPEKEWKPWVETKAATCTEPGEEKRENKNDATDIETRAIPALGHDWKDWVVKTPATCVAKGEEERVCNTDATHTETREIPLGDHDWDVWVEKTAPTCLTQGFEERECKTDNSHKDTRGIPALGHKWGVWETVTPATCTVDGEEKRVCERDNTHVEFRPILAQGHQIGDWETVLEPKDGKDGKRIRKCKIDDTILEEEVIPFKVAIWFANNTASTQGLRFREQKPELTNKWFMFTPVDLSQDGEQIIPIIASNMFYVGNLKLVVAGGNVTATYRFSRDIQVHSEFLTYFANLEAVTEVEPAQLAAQSVAFGEPYSIQEGLEGDTKVLLYTNFVITYHDEMAGVRRFYNGDFGYQKALFNMMGNLD